MLVCFSDEIITVNNITDKLFINIKTDKIACVKWWVDIWHVGVCFKNKITTVNIITDKIVCVGYPATIIFGGWQSLT